MRLFSVAAGNRSSRLGEAIGPGRAAVARVCILHEDQLFGSLYRQRHRHDLRRRDLLDSQVLACQHVLNITMTG